MHVRTCERAKDTRKREEGGEEAMSEREYMWEKSSLREVWERNVMLVGCLSRHQRELCTAWNTVREIVS